MLTGGRGPSGPGRMLTTIATLAAMSGVLAAPALATDGGGAPPTRSTPPSPARSLPSAGSSAVSASVLTRRVYYYGRQPAGVTYVLKGSQPQDVRIDLIRARDGRSLAHWIAYAVRPGVTHTLRWDGTVRRHVQRDGRYRFRIAVGPQPPRGSSAANSQAAAPELTVGSFDFLGNAFPIRGHHSYGTAVNRFGAPRAGHSHQGQDVLAACGTRLVAARGGRVKWAAYDANGGNYVVIHGAGSGLDYVYMHMRSAALVRKGQRVYTGQTIGYVGDTGDAQGCHLHFELWTRPGWYDGGHPFDPLPSLRAWDRSR